MTEFILVDSRITSSRTNWMAWFVCLSAGLFFFYEFFQLNLFDVINAQLRDEFHIDATQISWMSSTYLWADILFLLPAGAILDRFSTRIVILTAMLVCIAGTIGFALTNSFYIASFFHFLSGIGNAFCFLSCVVLVTQWFPPQRQALVIGCVVTMAFIGGMMAHTPLAYLNGHFGWRNSLIIDGAVGVIIFFWIFLVVKDHPTKAQKTSSISTKAPSTFSKVLLNHQNWLAGIYTSCLNLPIMVLCALWGASYLEKVHQLSSIQASNVVSLVFIGSIIGCPVVGWLSDCYGKRKPIMALGAAGTLLILLPFFLNLSLSESILSLLFFALGLFSSTQVISYPLIAESNSSSNTGKATGMSSVIIMGGGGVAQVLFGFLVYYHAQNVNYVRSDFEFAMWMFPVAICIALIALFFIKETNCKKLQ